MQKRNPWFFIPEVYFAEGLVYILVNTVSVIFYKKLGMSNALIGITSMLYLPWVIKMLWGPVVDGRLTKRTWIFLMQLAIGIALLGCAAVIPTSYAVAGTLMLFILAAFASATHDIAVDGFYMLALEEKEQTVFVGIRSLFYRVAMIFGSGFLVYLAGRLESGGGVANWSVVFIVAGVIYLLLAVFNKMFLPFPSNDRPVHSPAAEGSSPSSAFRAAFKSYFMQPKIIPIVFFILFYRLGEALLVKMIPPFLMDGHDAGGLGVATQQVGIIYGTMGIGGLSIGGIFGGLLIAKYGLRRCIWPYAIIMNLPVLFFVYMAYFKPSLPWVYLLVATEQFGYGLGMMALTIVQIRTAKGEFKTSHYAIATGIMALSMLVPGNVSGILQERLGYLGFFVLSAVLTLPGMIMIPFLPLEERQEESS